MNIQNTWQSHSQALQDKFVLTVTNFKKNGSFLEIGAQHPHENNNTYALHHHFGWSGFSIEIDPSNLRNWQTSRPSSPLVIANALELDYGTALPQWFPNSHKRIDYLQLDIDPSTNTLAVLKKLPLMDWRFSTITFETDAYTGDLRARNESRQILQELGYHLLVGDVEVLFPPVSKNPIAFEDWWIDATISDSLTTAGIKHASQTERLPSIFLK